MKPIIDNLMMLLSTDWFLGNWDLFELQALPPVQKTLQKRCRALVLDLVRGETDYWQVSFEENRIRKTHDQFFDACAKSRLSKEDIEKLREIALEAGTSAQQLEDISALELLSRVLVAAPEQVSPPRIEDGLRMKIASLFETNDSLLIDECENPHTEWDRHMRDLTPTMPARLADFAISVHQQRSHFPRFWQKVVEEVSAVQRNELYKWYERSGIELLDRHVVFPSSLRK